MEVPVSAGAAKFPYLEDIFQFSSMLRVTFLKTPMSDEPRYALCGHTVVMITHSVTSIPCYFVMSYLIICTYLSHICLASPTCLILCSFDQLFSHRSQPKNPSPDLSLSWLFGFFRFFFWSKIPKSVNFRTVGRNYTVIIVRHLVHTGPSSLFLSYPFTLFILYSLLSACPKTIIVIPLLVILPISPIWTPPCILYWSLTYGTTFVYKILQL